MANMFKSVLASARAVLQRKTVTPTTSVQTITPDSGYDGLEQVTVEAVNLQSKTLTMTPPSPSSWSATTTSLGTVTPDSGYTGLSQVDISIPMVPDNTTLTLQSSGSDYDTYKPSRAGYVYTSSYLRVPKSGGVSQYTKLEEKGGTSGNITTSYSSNYNCLLITRWHGSGTPTCKLDGVTQPNIGTSYLGVWLIFNYQAGQSIVTYGDQNTHGYKAYAIT